MTAVAMVLAYYGVQPKTPGGLLSDELYERMLDRGWAIYNPENVAKVVKEYGFQVIFQEKTTLQEIRNQIRKGYPVIMWGAYFIRSGHVVPLVGYTSTHFIANDSLGNANQDYTDRNGEKVLYSNQYLTHVNEGDGKIWAMFIYP